MLLINFRNDFDWRENVFVGSGFDQLQIIYNNHDQPLTAADGVGKNNAEIGKSAVIFDDIGFGGDIGFVFPALNPARPEDLNFDGH